MAQRSHTSATRLGTSALAQALELAHKGQVFADLHVGIEGRGFGEIADALLHFEGLLEDIEAGHVRRARRVGGRKQVRTRMVVVFPAPFGPRKPTIWPFSTPKEMLSTARVRAYRFVKPSTLIIVSHDR